MTYLLQYMQQGNVFPKHQICLCHRNGFMKRNPDIPPSRHPILVIATGEMPPIVPGLRGLPETPGLYQTPMQGFRII